MVLIEAIICVVVRFAFRMLLSIIMKKVLKNSSEEDVKQKFQALLTLGGFKALLLGFIICNHTLMRERRELRKAFNVSNFHKFEFGLTL